MKRIFLFVLLITLFTANICFSGNIKGKIKVDESTLNDVVVSLEPIEKNKFPISNAVAIMDQKNLNFVPHVLAVQVGTKVLFPNSDKIRHSVFSISKLKKFDFGTYPPGAEKSIICDQPGVIPILCYIHHNMSAYIVVLATPYFAVTNDAGDYSINNIPAGRYKISFWHEELEIKSREITIPAEGTIIKNISVQR